MNSLKYSLCISISVHAFVLWWLFSTVSLRSNRISQITAALSSSQPELSKSEGTPPSHRSRQPSVKRSQAEVGRKSIPASRETVAASESLDKLPLQSAESEAAGGGTQSSTGETSGVQGDVGDQLGDVAVGSGGAVSSPGGITAGTKGTTSERGKSFVASGSRGFKKSSTPSEVDSFSGAEIPGYVIDAAGFRPPDAGAIYPEVDRYVLYGADKRTPTNVEGTEVCIDGEFLRSKEAMTISEIKTDYSKCHYLDFGDDSIPTVKCAPEAHTKIVHHNTYLSSPLIYSVRSCLEYDTSHCHVKTDEDTEREVCRIDFQYEGLWAEGTKFFYRCAKSETRTYRQPLQYNIRWFMEVYIEERGLRRREILRETRAVSQCG